MFSYKAINILNGYVKKDDTQKTEQKQPEQKEEPKAHQGEARTNETGGLSNSEASKKEGNNWNKIAFSSNGEHTNIILG